MSNTSKKQERIAKDTDRKNKLISAMRANLKRRKQQKSQSPPIVKSTPTDSDQKK